jgi:hypothetical protein
MLSIFKDIIGNHVTVAVISACPILKSIRSITTEQNASRVFVYLDSISDFLDKLTYCNNVQLTDSTKTERTPQHLACTIFFGRLQLISEEVVLLIF